MKREHEVAKMQPNRVCVLSKNLQSNTTQIINYDKPVSLFSLNSDGEKLHRLFFFSSAAFIDIQMWECQTITNIFQMCK